MSTFASRVFAITGGASGMGAATALLLAYGFAGNSLATMFGGLISYGVVHIRGAIPAWKWPSTIYGLITMVWALTLLFFLPDSPSTARFLRSKEREAAEERLKHIIQMPMGVVHAVFCVGSTFLAGKFPNSHYILLALCTTVSEGGKPGTVPAVVVEDLTDVDNHNFRYVY